MADTLLPDIVMAVANAKGIEPDELDISLQEYIDTDAIELLASHHGGSWTLSFELPGHNVTVTSDGLVLVDGTPKETWL